MSARRSSWGPSLTSADIRDGDLPPGVYERMPDGTLVPTNKVLTNDPPRPLHVGVTGRILDITSHQLSDALDVVEQHYEARKAATGQAAPQRDDVRDLVGRAADAVMEANK